MSTSVRKPPRRRTPVRAVSLYLLVAAMAVVVAVLARPRRSHPAVPKPAPVAPTAAAPLSVAVEAISARPFAHPIRVTGTLQSDEVVALSTKATGLVRQVLAKVGDRVHRGQLLVRIDDRDLRAQREKAQAAVQSAEARLEQAVTARGVKNAAVQSDYRRAVQALAAARTRLAQAKSMAGISATEVESSVASARAALQSAREQLKVRREGARRQEKAAAELSVARAQAQLSKLKGQLERREQLLQEGAIAREDVENTRRDYEAALAEWNAARQQADLVNEGSRTEEIRQAEEAVRQAEASLRTAEANRARRGISHQDVDAAQTQVRQAEAEVDSTRAALAQRQWNNDEIDSARAALAQARADVRYYEQLIAQTQVFSPVDGIVSQRKIHVGEAVSPTKAELMTLVATNTLYFEATAPESELPYLRPGQPASVMLDALPGRTLAGAVREIIPVSDGSSRSLRLRIAIARPENAGAVVGGFARATVQGESSRPVLTVPRSAVVSDEGEKTVFLVENGHARRRPVQVGAENEDRVEVLSGLKPGDRVVIDASPLTDGQPVRLARPNV